MRKEIQEIINKVREDKDKWKVSRKDEIVAHYLYIRKNGNSGTLYMRICPDEISLGCGDTIFIYDSEEKKQIESLIHDIYNDKLPDSFKKFNEMLSGEYSP